jgi:hypothetical protein
MTEGTATSGAQVTDADQQGSAEAAVLDPDPGKRAIGRGLASAERHLNWCSDTVQV